jgi:hypothetical protein
LHFSKHGASATEFQRARCTYVCAGEQFRIWCVVSDLHPVESPRMVIRILFVSWAVFLLASQLVCGCATFFHWLSAG